MDAKCRYYIRSRNIGQKFCQHSDCFALVFTAAGAAILSKYSRGGIGRVGDFCRGRRLIGEYGAGEFAGVASPVGSMNPSGRWLAIFNCIS
jgi:hypothetical protein